MSLRTVAQLHTDLQQLIRKDQYADVDSATVDLFNANLEEAKSQTPARAVLNAVPKASSSTSAADLLIYSGQLQAVLEDYQDQISGK